LDIVNTVELKFSGDAIDEPFTVSRLDSYKKIFPDLECIGWYTAQRKQTDAPAPNDAILQKKFQAFCENPLLAILSPESEEAARKKILPLFIYEYGQLSAGNSGFFRQEFSLASSDSERIAVDHVQKAIDTSTLATTSQLSTGMTNSLNALKILRQKLKALIETVRNRPEIRSNHTFMRKL